MQAEVCQCDIKLISTVIWCQRMIITTGVKAWENWMVITVGTTFYHNNVHLQVLKLKNMLKAPKAMAGEDDSRVT